MCFNIKINIEIPITLAWDIKYNIRTLHGVATLLIDIFLCIDIIVNFRTAIFDKYDNFHLVIHPKAIAKNYIFGWFFIDLVTSIPFEGMYIYTVYNLNILY